MNLQGRFRPIGVIGSVALYALSISAIAQQTSSSALSFEAATVKLNEHPDGRGPGCRGINSSDRLTGPLGRCVLRGFTLAQLVMAAHNIRPAFGDTQELFVNMPGWGSTDTFDVDAKAEAPDTATQEQLLLMLQSLLADRFKLRFHKDVRAVNGYRMVVGKDGVKLRESDGTEKLPGIIMAKVDGSLTAERVSIPQLAKFLSTRIGEPILDNTGLTGLYNISLTWTPSEVEAHHNVPGGESNAPSFFTAVQEQLGFNLERARINSEVYVIDQVGRPAKQN